MTGTPTLCRACGHDPRDEPAGGGALQRCEVCGAWVPVPRAPLGRDLTTPVRTGVLAAGTGVPT